MSELLNLNTGNDGSLDYEAFLRENVAFDRSFGFEVADEDLPSALTPHQAAIVKRMLTLQSEQSRRALEFHACPLQFDIGRHGRMAEPNPVSCRDAVMYQREADPAAMPSLFDLLAIEGSAA